MSEVILFYNLNPKNIPSVFDSFIKPKLNDYYEYMIFSESEMENRHKKYLSGLLKSQVEYLEVEGLLEYSDPYARRFSEIQRNSFLIMIHALLEEYVIDLCCIERGAWTDFKFTEQCRKMSTIQKAFNFITKKLKKDIPIAIDDWENINKVNNIRNCLVHCGGDITRIENKKRIKDIREHIEKMDYISINAFQVITLEKEFCLNYIKVVNRFLSSLYKNF
ncbi:hypothetical protein [Bacillus subtilis]|uniref:Uncharacterized protein n=1 Tax=Bacillus subtilis TaxID=1423 RepID=A0AC61ZZW3_BACIU